MEELSFNFRVPALTTCLYDEHFGQDGSFGFSKSLKVVVKVLDLVLVLVEFLVGMR